MDTVCLPFSLLQQPRVKPVLQDSVGGLQRQMSTWNVSFRGFINGSTIFINGKTVLQKKMSHKKCYKMTHMHSILMTHMHYKKGYKVTNMHIILEKSRICIEYTSM